MRTKLIVRYDVIAMRFGQKSFFSSISGLSPHRDYKLYEYLAEKNINLSKIHTVHSKCDVIDGSILNGLQEPILPSFFLNNPAGYKVFCMPETIHF